MKIEIPFRGHKNILSLHKKTIEITKDSQLTVNGDCIVGVNSSLACVDLSENLKKKIRNPDTEIVFTILADESAFTCSRTIAIKCDKASDDIPRKMVKKLQNPKTVGKLVIEIK